MPAAPLIGVDAVRTRLTRLTRRFGLEVGPWCAALPDLANDLAARWHLSLAPAWPNGGTSVVLPCESAAGEQRVLKLTPDPTIAVHEATALTAWAGSPHAVTLHDADPARGALLLERIQPGSGPRMLIHGDLHQANVLRGAPGQRLVAIDPRPCLGDPAFDAIDWVLADGGEEPEVRQRIERLAACADGLDPDRVWAWCQAMAIVVGVIALIARDDIAAGERLIALARN